MNAIQSIASISCAPQYDQALDCGAIGDNLPQSCCQDIDSPKLACDFEKTKCVKDKSDQCAHQRESAKECDGSLPAFYKTKCCRGHSCNISANNGKCMNDSPDTINAGISDNIGE